MIVKSLCGERPMKNIVGMGMHKIVEQMGKFDPTY
jgi:hypothetical protein